MERLKNMKIVEVSETSFILEDGTELPITFDFDRSISLKELNKLYAKSCEFIQGLQNSGGDN